MRTTTAALFAAGDVRVPFARFRETAIADAELQADHGDMMRAWRDVHSDTWDATTRTGHEGDVASVADAIHEGVFDGEDSGWGGGEGGRGRRLQRR